MYATYVVMSMTLPLVTQRTTSLQEPLLRICQKTGYVHCAALAKTSLVLLNNEMKGGKGVLLFSPLHCFYNPKNRI